MRLRKSPFKPDDVERDPNGFALRVDNIYGCVSSLFNNKNVLITGPRGIGKSSLASQIQYLYTPDTTLLKRCSIDGELGRYLQIYYAVDGSSSLSDICLDILHRIETNTILLKTHELSDKKKIRVELNLGVFKTSLESEVVSRKPSSVVTQFVGALTSIYNSISLIGFEGINIVIDELDCISDEINFAHFLKLIHEYFSADSIENITFLLAGQRGLYSRLTSEDKSVERLITHVPISKLCTEESEHILDYASRTASPQFSIDDDAKKAILKIAGGFPYEIHLLADAAFSNMDSEIKMTMKDVSDGLGHVLRADKHEKYVSYLSEMIQPQRIIMSILGAYESKEMPAMIPFEWVFDEGNKNDLGKECIIKNIEEIRNLGFIVIDFDEETVQFNDELFRLFIILRQKYMELDQEEYDSEIVVEPYTEEEVHNLVDYFEGAEANLDWDIDETGHLIGY
jgi:energy-coupling factor transporter ATP-binding protein EcfA2